MVHEGGLGNLTLKKVAERVGFTEAAIYRHFASKRELIFGLIGLLEGRLLDTVTSIAGDATLPPRERIERMVRHHVALLRATQGLPLLLVSEGLATGDEELVARLGAVMARYRGLLADVLRQLPARTDLPPAQQAVLFLGLPAALGILMRAHPETPLGEEQTDALVRFYVRALTGAESNSEEDPA